MEVKGNDWWSKTKKLGLAKTIHTYAYTVYIRYFWQGFTIHTVIYGVHIRFWPTQKKHMPILA